MSSGLNIYYQNVRGLRTKCLQLRQNILTNSYDIIIITETWLYDGIFDNELCDNRYDVFRVDRDVVATSKMTGGGVMMLVQRSLGAVRRGGGARADSEMLWVSVPARALGATADLHLAVAYIPPDPHTMPRDISCFTDMVTALVGSNLQQNYLFVGDFNLANLKWSRNGPFYLKRGPIEVQNIAHSFYEGLVFLGLTQYNTLTNHAGNTLDLAFSNLPLVVTRSVCLPL